MPCSLHQIRRMKARTALECGPYQFLLQTPASIIRLTVSRKGTFLNLGVTNIMHVILAYNYLCTFYFIHLKLLWTTLAIQIGKVTKGVECPC